MKPASKLVPIPKNGVDYRGKVVLAPMVRSGELPSRLLALKYGADLVWGPETVDKAMIGTTRRCNPLTSTIDFTRVSSNGVRNPSLGTNQRESIIYRLHPQREGRRLVFQLGTSNPENAVKAAKLVAADVSGIDVNAGCPKPFSTTGGMGAALLRTPDVLCAILRALVREVGEVYEIGISVKMRLLETPEQTEELVRKLERAIREQLRMIADVCREAGVACLMNGDVVDRDSAIELIKDYGVDGAMIATAAERNPSCFRSKEEGGLASWEEVVREYMKVALEVENRWGNTKFLLSQIMPGKDPKYVKTNQSKSYEEVVQILGLEEELADVARDVDKRLDIKPKETRAERKAKANESARAAGGDTRKAKKQRPTQRMPQPRVNHSQPGVATPEMPLDVSREAGPGSLSEAQAPVLAV
ncbi:hypothetical protein B0A49_10404 [Cryomyces minteri]|uniref:DUS-like FMN-binding domain-containing protein n=1 Tax=Cryomyces minteri TaxID=331657 RepID=A0A4U0WFH3_9PEZI|nr:hypothetical protein B0A49_10404 [Cryomyces minteri]